jgi:rhodanese-related sulfurtransferase
MDEISAPDAAQLLADQPDQTILLDVREEAELEAAAVADAFHLPMGEIPARLAEIDKMKTIICMCRSGGRSAQVADFLARQGYDKVFNLTGGIHAWSDLVDNSIPKH